MPDALHAKARILIVDDNPVNVSLLQDMLEDAGYDLVSGETDPRKVQATLEAVQTDLILLDLRMPHIDGHELMDRLRTRFATRLPPIIVLTAENSAAARYRALEQGAADFLTKPFDQTEVLQRIHNQLDAHLRSEAHRGRANDLEVLVAERTAELRALSLRDPLTGLPNRRALRSDIERRMATDQQFAVYFVLLEEFDELARAYGYELCESVSKAVADLLAQSALLKSGMVCAWGDREFVLTLEHEDSPSEFAQRAQRLLRLLGGRLDVDGIRVDLSARIGAVHRHDCADRADLVQRATSALLITSAGSRFARYEAQISQRLLRQRQIRLALREAVRDAQLELVYQPKMSFSSGRPVGAEALLRWTHPEFGVVSPVEFVPLAESCGEILEIGAWVLDRGMAQLAEWRTAGLVDEQFSLALNVSGLQLMQDDFAERTLAIHRQYQLPAGAIEVEVTESGLMEDVTQAIRQLETLSAAGIPSAIDDFGTGYSSLSYLKSLPVSVLKIDRSFVSGINTDVTDRRLAETVVAIAHAMGCQVVAEGVETVDHAATLKAIGCDVGQGYYYSRPLSVKQFSSFVRQL